MTARLVSIGNSLTQGFGSLAITNTHQSYPALIATALGLDLDQQFRQPDFRGSGGLPCSIEWLARRLQQRFGADFSLFEAGPVVLALGDLLDEVEDYWERGPGSRPGADVRFHNLAAWGFEVGDAYGITAQLCADAIAPGTAGAKDNWLKPPSEARLRSALAVLNPARSPARALDTQLAVAKKIAGAEGGIDNLLVCLGGNNCLKTVVELKIEWTGVQPPGPGSAFTLWRPEAFLAEYRRLEQEVQALGAKRVYVATIPHVTIPPFARGVMNDRKELPPGRKYFDHYTYFFIGDANFDPDRDKNLSAAQAEQIDATIDAYNDIVKAAAARNGWHVVDLCHVLDELAVRRNQGRPRYPLPEPIKDLSVSLLEYTPGGKIKQGGLISLDGIHPTTCGYGIVAQEFIKVMRPFEPTIRDVDFARLRLSDTLISEPPRTLDDMLGAVRTLERWFHVTRWMNLSV